jgi:hypothetical protein
MRSGFPTPINKSPAANLGPLSIEAWAGCWVTGWDFWAPRGRWSVEGAAVLGVRIHHGEALGAGLWGSA